MINNGTFNLASGDDGMHADKTLEINNGEFQITQSYEGIESAAITINDGYFQMIASDDGINVAGGNDGSGMGQGMRPGGKPNRGGGPGQDTYTSSGSYTLDINGGYIYVDAAGDGIDVNGAITMTGGTVIVNGPTQNMNGALDYDQGFNISGGFLLAVGSAGMAQAPGTSSSQNSILVNFNSAQQAGTLIHIQGSNGEDILTFSPTKVYQSIAFSSADIVTGTTYDMYLGGSSTGTATDGLYEGGTYSSGTQYTSLTISGVVTSVGGGGFRR